MVEHKQDIIIGFSFFSELQAHLWGMVSYFAQIEAKTKGITLITKIANYDIPKQAKQVQELIDSQVNAIIIAAYSTEDPNLIAVVRKAVTQGIPVIAMDSEIGNGDCTCVVGVDNVKSQAAVATYIFEKLGRVGKVAHLQGTPHIRSAILRTEGLHKALAQYPNIDLVFEEHADYTGDFAFEIMMNCLEAHPDIDAVIAANDVTAQGVIAAIEEANITREILITGFDAQTEAFVPMQLGKIKATVKYDPQQMAIISIDLALRALNGEAVPKQNFLAVQLVTAENLNIETANYISIIPDFVTHISEINTQLQQEIEDRKQAQADLKAHAEALEQAQLALKTHADELEQSNQELQNFAFVASHDLREPLRKIQIFGSRLQERYSDVLDKRGLDYLDRMQNGSARMQIFIEDLLAYASLSKKLTSFEQTDLNQMLQNVLDDIKIRIQETDADIHYEALPIIEANPTLMRQLWQNLLSNAIKFRQAGSHPIIHIESQRIENDQVQMTVADNGIGFEPEFGERIFGMFQRLHGRSAYEGTGIGLAICRKIVEQHQGTISATGVKGKGATFTITLPINQKD